LNTCCTCELPPAMRAGYTGCPASNACLWIAITKSAIAEMYDREKWIPREASCENVHRDLRSEPRTNDNRDMAGCFPISAGPSSSERGELSARYRASGKSSASQRLSQNAASFDLGPQRFPQTTGNGLCSDAVPSRSSYTTDVRGNDSFVGNFQLDSLPVNGSSFVSFCRY